MAETEEVLAVGLEEDREEAREEAHEVDHVDADSSFDSWCDTQVMQMQTKSELLHSNCQVEVLIVVVLKS